MVSILLQFVGVACLVAFLFIAWPPLVLAFFGLALTLGVELVDR